MSKLDHTLKLMPQSQGELAKDEIKILMLEVFGKALKGSTFSEVGEIFRKEVKDL